MSDSGRTMRPYCHLCRACHDERDVVICRDRLAVTVDKLERAAFERGYVRGVQRMSDGSSVGESVLTLGIPEDKK